MARSSKATALSPQEPEIVAPAGTSTLQDVLYALELALHAIETLSPEHQAAFGSRPSLASMSVNVLRLQVRMCRDSVQARIAQLK